ncbi:hypothetical protein [Leucobacter soli]|uniref:hypothetical protein n=1 Tax=Leucobacter soli TaxID=2812850 RepID=UPI00361FA341
MERGGESAAEAAVRKIGPGGLLGASDALLPRITDAIGCGGILSARAMRIEPSPIATTLRAAKSSSQARMSASNSGSPGLAPPSRAQVSA